MNFSDPLFVRMRNLTMNMGTYGGVAGVFLIWAFFRGTHPELYAIAIAPIALACFIFALVPAGNAIDRWDETLMKYGIPISPVFGRVMNFLFGAFLVGLIFYLIGG